MVTNRYPSLGEKVHNDFVDISYYLTVEPVKHPYQVLITQKQVQ